MKRAIAVAFWMLVSALLCACSTDPVSHAGQAPAGQLAPAPGHKTLPNYILGGDASS